MGVPGATGAGEFFAALSPAPAPAKPGKELRGPNLRLELNIESHIGESVVVVINFDLVENVGIERKVVGPVAGFEKGIHIHDECDPVGMVITYKRIKVCDVCGVV